MFILYEVYYSTLFLCEISIDLAYLLYKRIYLICFPVLVVRHGLLSVFSCVELLTNFDLTRLLGT